VVDALLLALLDVSEWDFARVVALALAVTVTLGLIECGFRLLRRADRWWAHSISDSLTRYSRWPARVSAVLLVADLALPTLHLPQATEDLVDHVLSLALIAAVAWLIVGLSFSLEDLALARYRVDVSDNLRARRIHTQVMVLRRLTVVIVSLLALAVMLTTFTSFRVLGASLLASAGIASIVIGVAAQPLVSNFLAGIQILFAEPIRVDDVVVVEGEWGRVEEITFTYVVVHIWDDRRLVLPITYFLKTPFQNWTRSSAHLLGSVLLRVDFTVPVGAVREELQRIVERSERWDGRFWNLQVTDVAQGSVELRALVSAPDATTAWDLRCEVREQLLTYLQLKHPESLPRTRVWVADGAEARRTWPG
jgi:small-conductance mechanosensitive channel